MSTQTFFFNKKILCNLSVSVFIANALNLIMKLAMCFLLCLDISIFHSVSVALLLLLNIILIFLTNLSQSWVSVSLSSLSSFFCIYMPATLLLRQTRITVILLSISVTLLLLRNNWIPLYQSSNFVLSSLHYSGSRTILLGNSTCLLCMFPDATKMLSVYSVVLSEASSIIFNDPSHSDNTFILCSQY